MATILRGSDNLDSSKVLSEELAGSIVTDASGRVTMPYQPAFLAYGSPSTSDSSLQALSWSYTRSNIGGHFSTANNRFTAPVAGTYFFTASILSDDTNIVTSNIKLLVNGGHTNFQAYAWNGGRSGSDQTTSISAALYLNANDYVQVASTGTWDVGQVSHMESYNVFSGFLVG